MRSTVATKPLAAPTRTPAPIRAASRHDSSRAQVRRDDGRERVGGADREIDAARDEHERPGGGDDEDRRLLVEDVQQIDPRREGVARQREDDEEDAERERIPASRRRSHSRDCSSSPSAGESLALLRSRLDAQARSLPRTDRRTPPRGSPTRSWPRPRARRPAGPIASRALGAQGRGSPRARTR